MGGGCTHVPTKMGGGLKKGHPCLSLFLAPSLTTNKWALKEYKVYQTPEGEECGAPLITSLLQIKEDQWEIEFDQEGEVFLPNDVIKIMIDRVCVD